MKHLYSLLLPALLALPHTAAAQGVGIGTTTPAGAAALEISSTTQGLLLPRMSQAEMEAITSPEAGLLVYNTSAQEFYGYRFANRHPASSSNTALYDVTYTGPSVGRSFSPFSDGELGQVLVGGIGAGNGSTGTFPVGVAVYAGVGFNGPPLGQLTVLATWPDAGANNILEVDLSALHVVVATGQPYTLRFSQPTVGIAVLTETERPGTANRTGSVVEDTGAVQAADFFMSLLTGHAAGWVPVR